MVIRIVFILVMVWVALKVSKSMQRALDRARQKRRILRLVKEWQTADMIRVREITRLLLHLEVPE